MIRVNGQPLELVEPEILRTKVQEPLLLLGKQRFAGIDVRVRVRGGGYTAQIYAIRQAIAKAVVAWNQKCTPIIWSNLPACTAREIRLGSCFCPRASW